MEVPETTLLTLRRGRSADGTSFVNHHPFGTFVAVAYAISWSLWGIAYAGGGEVPFLAIGLHASFTPAQDHLILLPRDEAYSVALDAPDFAILGVHLVAVALLLLLTRGRLGVPARPVRPPDPTPAGRRIPRQPEPSGSGSDPHKE